MIDYFDPGRIKYYDRDGQPLNKIYWPFLFECDFYRVLELTELKTVRISTIWLGFNTGLGPGPHGCFESVVFDSVSKFRDLDQIRYNTEAEALGGHAELVKKYGKNKEVKTNEKSPLSLYYYSRDLKESTE